MFKPRGDSLYAKLAAADPSLELREWVFYAALVEGKTLEDIGGALQDKGILTSEQSISNMIRRHSLRWKLDKSREAAREVDQWKPDKKRGSLPEQIKKNLRKQIFNATMQELSVKEMVALHRTQLAETSLNIQLYDLQTECAGIIAEVLRGGARAEEMRALAADKGLTGADFVQAIRLKVYGDAAADIPTGEETV